MQRNETDVINIVCLYLNPKHYRRYETERTIRKDLLRGEKAKQSLSSFKELGRKLEFRVHQRGGPW